MTDVRLDMIERTIEGLGYGTPEYHEAMAFYLTILARAQWRAADEARARRARLKSGRSES